MEMITGRAYVLGDNVDTDQIIPAEYLSYDPSIPEERKLFGRYALAGVPLDRAGLPNGGIRFVDPDNKQAGTSVYSVVIAGKNFGCGSSREHAPLALAEAGVKVVVAQSYARIFFRNSVNGAYVIPVQCVDRLIDVIATGDEVQVDADRSVLVNCSDSKEYALKGLGDAAEIIEAGGLFAYARKEGIR